MKELDLLIENYFTESFETSDLFRLVEQVMEEDVVTEKNLSFGDLAKSPTRMQTFINKLKNNEPFELVGGGSATFVADSTLLDALEQMLQSGEISHAAAQRLLGRKFYLVTPEGDPFPIGRLQKTGEFGGKGSDFYVKKEIAARGQLEAAINAALKNANTDAITLRVKNGKEKVVAVYDDVIGVRGSSRFDCVDPKSDFELIRKDGKPPVYISHKDGTTPKGFGQWSGVSPKAGENIHNHPEVKRFIKDLKPYLVRNKQGELVYPKGISYGRLIEDVELKLMSIFGQDYTPSGDGGPNNVDLVAQGLFTIETVGVDEETDDGPEVVYDLSAHHLLARLDPEVDFGKEYMPTLVSRYATARRNFGIKHLRATIYPLGGRKIAKMI
ncbi:MAG: hypothetical protein JSV97_01050 [candidate division WOR-3 bacterium]|nr:MAG: hypothetical protein JSV97_01050 [candidate division WOR-3 bacterium]